MDEREMLRKDEKWQGCVRNRMIKAEQEKIKRRRWLERGRGAERKRKPKPILAPKHTLRVRELETALTHLLLRSSR